ncbi:hypothetical protein HY3_15445 [Hyphomonas pacifica]|uniref:Uncharacterized protein n=1 Tax=Hyphomonas pacifica TaxID=1280941 RepID=A0A8B2PPU0_9PROT|nr:hypothetical protein HY3_15445 [Hyphomonas pacifica]
MRMNSRTLMWICRTNRPVHAGVPLSTQSAIIQLCADEFQASPCDAVRPAASGGDGALALQLAEEAEVQARIAPAIAGKAMQLFRFVVVVTGDFDMPALCEQMEDALFGA